MIRFLLSSTIGLLLAIPGFASAQTLDQEIASLAGRISKALADQGYKSVAAVDFKDLQGNRTELGRFLADQLAVEIVSGGGVSMVDRANIKSILAEHMLTEEGLVKPENAKKLGEFAGVDAILNGVVTALDERIVLTVSATATSTSRIVAAGRITFATTSDIRQLLNRSVEATLVTPPAGGGATSANPLRYQDATTIATKDFGSRKSVV